MANTSHLTHFDNDGLLFSQQFNDHYFSRNGGAAECLHVFLSGNELPKRWENGHNFNIGELGFGTGLNFLTTWQNWQRNRKPDQVLNYTSVEAFPVEQRTAQQALEPYAEFHDLREALFANWDNICSAPTSLPAHAIELDEQTRLQVVVMPVEQALDEFPQVDAWYLDGFATSRNPDMWSLGVMQKIASLTGAGGTFASYTSAGWVRRNLQQAGFQVEKRPGFGTKRDMIAGYLT